MDDLTYQQEAIFKAIVREIDRGLPPTIRELCDEFGYVSTNAIADVVRVLERKGWLERRRPNVARGLLLTPASRRHLGRAAWARRSPSSSPPRPPRSGSPR